MSICTWQDCDEEAEARAYFDTEIASKPLDYCFEHLLEVDALFCLRRVEWLEDLLLSR